MEDRRHHGTGVSLNRVEVRLEGEFTRVERQKSLPRQRRQKLQDV